MMIIENFIIELYLKLQITRLNLDAYYVQN